MCQDSKKFTVFVGINDLKKDKAIRSNLCKLKPFVDVEGIVRIGGRLDNATITVNQRVPIIIPSGTNFSKLIMLHKYKNLMNHGPQATFAAVQSKYWPIRGRGIVRKVIHKFVS